MALKTQVMDTKVHFVWYNDVRASDAVDLTEPGAPLFCSKDYSFFLCTCFILGHGIMTRALRPDPLFLDASEAGRAGFASSLTL